MSVMRRGSKSGAAVTGRAPQQDGKTAKVTTTMMARSRWQQGPYLIQPGSMSNMAPILACLPSHTSYRSMTLILNKPSSWIVCDIDKGIGLLPMRVHFGPQAECKTGNLHTKLSLRPCSLVSLFQHFQRTAPRGLGSNPILQEHLIGKRGSVMHLGITITA